jgi:hypothetical protein
MRAVHFLILTLSVSAWAAADYAKDIRPVLMKRCFACHNEKSAMSGMRVDQPDKLIAGGYSGAAITPGNSAHSRIVDRVTSRKEGYAMPPAGPPLSESEVALLREWIDAGARFDQTALKPEAKAKPALWSFQPLRQPALPSLQNSAWAKNPIDAFVLARLEKEGLKPSEEASRETLLRRASLDLTGLLPTPEAIQTFLDDRSTNAWERAVDRLLASPHYGEKWARHWLDLARYADSDGFEKDLVRPWAWRWRDWVIRSLNEDLNFRDFSIQQLAGDLLPRRTQDQLIATGFNRNTLTNREAGVAREEDRFEQLVNRVNTVSTTWLGLTYGCAQCHDHKYDPISQKEYYQLMAVFNTSREKDIAAPLPGEQGAWMRAQPAFRAEVDKLLENYCVADFQRQWEERMRETIRHPGRNLEWDFQITSMRVMFDRAEEVLLTPAEARDPRDSMNLLRYFLGSNGPDIGKQQSVKDQLRAAREDLNQLFSRYPQMSEAYIMEEMPKPQPQHIAVRGDYKRKGIPVTPGTLSALPPFPAAGTEHPRLRFARWLVSDENPLTARVIVNRIWQDYFGRGLVRTSEDFGFQGEKPTHPELLDWLASDFQRNGWSLKQLHRTIVTSATYRQTSKQRPELQERDPDNTLLARQARLRMSGELVRDAALASSGLLNDRIGGASVRPPQPKGVSELGYGTAARWVDATGPDRYRRGLYIHFQRTVPYPMLMNFDMPDGAVACSRRRTSNTPLQALNLLNDPAFVEAAQALALRTLQSSSAPDFASRLDYLYQLSLGRRPRSSEATAMQAFFAQQKAGFMADVKQAALLAPVSVAGVPTNEAAAWTALSRVVLNLEEFFTRE